MLGYGMKILSSVIVDGKWYVSGMYMQAQEGQALLEQAERDVRRSPIARIGLVIDADVEGGEAGSTAAAAASELADNAPKGEQRRGQRRHVFRSGSVSASIKSASVTLEAHDEHSGSVLEAGASQHLPQDERGGCKRGLAREQCRGIWMVERCHWKVLVFRMFLKIKRQVRGMIFAVESSSWNVL